MPSSIKQLLKKFNENASILVVTSITCVLTEIFSYGVINGNYFKSIIWAVVYIMILLFTPRNFLTAKRFSRYDDFAKFIIIAVYFVIFNLIGFVVDRF